MAATWICEVCGRANAGDLCPGCATPRPINVRYWRIGHDQGYKGVYDGVSPGRFTPLVLVPVAAFVISFFLVSPPLGLGLAGLALLIPFWSNLVAAWWWMVRLVRRR